MIQTNPCGLWQFEWMLGNTERRIHAFVSAAWKLFTSSVPAPGTMPASRQMCFWVLILNQTTSIFTWYVSRLTADRCDSASQFLITASTLLPHKHFCVDSAFVSQVITSPDSGEKNPLQHEVIIQIIHWSIFNNANNHYH